ncbi:MAG TPA: phosphotransferase [Candidatus Limnocylindrales bacterium]
MLTQLPPLTDLLATHRLAGKPEQRFPHDGWSGATLTRFQRGIRRFVLKRDSLATDWIAQATHDGPLLREAWFAATHPLLPWPLRAPYVGAAVDGDAVAILMPDLSDVLLEWEAPLDTGRFERVLGAIAALHAARWADEGVGPANGPWCSIEDRILLICRPSLERPGPVHDAVADRLLPGWDAFDRTAPAAARELVAALADDPGPLIAALDALPKTLLHGDLKLANVGITADGSVDLIDWQMVMFGPVAIELGWFLAANVAALPLTPDEVLARYAALRADEEPPVAAADLELAWIVGLLLRGWRKGHDAEAGTLFASGMTGADDLELWCRRAVDAANRLPGFGAG